MKIKHSHSWDVSPKEAAKIQRNLACKIRLNWKISLPQFVAGADISFSKGSTDVYAGVVILSFPSLKLIHAYSIKGRLKFSYVPGLLSFREAPLLLKLFSKIQTTPDLIFFDGQGLAHPRRFGLACHMGLLLNCSTVGCAKNKLTGNFKEPGEKKGSINPLIDENGDTLGSVLRSRDACKPIFISPGHKIDFKNATKYALACCAQYRIPEPIRLAHLLVNRIRIENQNTQGNLLQR